MGTEAAPSSSTFFRILLPGFPKKLPLPTKFSKIALIEENSKTASLVNPNGDSWLVSVHRDDGDMYIGGRGWLDLVHAHNLGLGYLLIFQYEGNSVFRFRVFDLSTCEIAYPSAARKPKQTPVGIKAEDEEEDEQKPLISECTKTASASNVGAKKHHPKGHAGEGRYEVKLSAYNLLRGDLRIPMRFREYVGLRPEQEEVTLKDPKGRLWAVGISRKGPKGNRTLQLALRKGWIRLARANNLEVGDRCAFEVGPQGQGHAKVWQMTILKNHA